MIHINVGEKILTIEHRHWLPIILESISIAIAALVPFILMIGIEFLPQAATAIISEYNALIWFLYACWLLVLWMFFAVSITNYYLDVLIVTSYRVIDIEQIGLFSRDTAELQLDSIEDVHVEIKGFISSLLNYGDLYIQTSSEIPEFALKNIRDPHRVQNIISAARLAELGHEVTMPDLNK